MEVPKSEIDLWYFFHCILTFVWPCNFQLMEEVGNEVARK